MRQRADCLASARRACEPARGLRRVALDITLGGLPETNLNDTNPIPIRKGESCGAIDVEFTYVYLSD